MTSALPTDFSLGQGSSPSVQGDERPGIPIKKHIEASKGSLVLVETFPPVLTSLEPMQDVADRASTIKEHDKASKSPLVKIEEIIQSPNFLNQFQDTEERPPLIEDHGEALKNRDPIVGKLPRYHEDDTAHYCLPNEQVSQEHVRLETQAKFLSKMMGDRVLHAPIDTTATHVLDVGCGTGIVTHLMSDAYPGATCIGLDLSETPRLRPQAANVRFLKGNVTAQTPTQWTTADGESVLQQDEALFDYVFSRLLILGMTDWQSFLRTEYSLLKPGGWAEVHDLAWDWYDADGTLVSEEWSWLRRIRNELESGKGMDLSCGKKAKAWMEEAGFVDVRAYAYIYPFCGSSESSTEMRAYGHFNAKVLPTMLDDAIPRVMHDACFEEKESLLADMRRALLPGKKLHQIFFVTIGRKPFAFEKHLDML